MKTMSEMFTELEVMIRRLEDTRHRICFLNADIRLTEYEKMAKADIVLQESESELETKSKEIQEWLFKYREGAKNGNRNMVGPVEESTVDMQDKGVSPR